jgi:hypothetical protein
MLHPVSHRFSEKERLPLLFLGSQIGFEGLSIEIKRAQRSDSNSVLPGDGDCYE